MLLQQTSISESTAPNDCSKAMLSKIALNLNPVLTHPVVQHNIAIMRAVGTGIILQSFVTQSQCLMMLPVSEIPNSMNLNTAESATRAIGFQLNKN